MNRHELFDRIRTWNSMYEQIGIPASENAVFDAIGIKINAQFKNDQLQSVAALEVAEELIGTPVEDDLRKAIAYGKSSDPSKLDEIQELLHKVQKYMHENFTLIQ